MNLKALDKTLALLRNEEIVDFNLADLVLTERRIFRMSSISRADMPQLKGFPRGGSVACYLEADKKGKVDVSTEFLNWLISTFAVHTWSQTVTPANLSGAQNELVASKVARHVEKMRRDPKHKKFTQQYIVSKDSVLLDGHHGWAAVMIHNLLNNEDHKLNVLRLDMHIGTLIEHARTFTHIIGILPKEGV